MIRGLILIFTNPVIQNPILLKGHDRSITTVKYGPDGDLIFTAAKDQKPTVWYADSGERIGTFSKLFYQIMYCGRIQLNLLFDLR